MLLNFKSHILIIFFLTLLALFLRVYKIDEYPVQLNHDEITQIYDAVSIAETGKDIYGNHLPFIFKSINDYKPPYYTYATSLVYFLFGDHEYIIKIPGLIFGILAIPVVYFFTKVLFQNKLIAIMAAFFTSIAPFEIFYSRKSFESGTGIVLTMLGLGFILSYIQARVKLRLFLGTIILGLAMYVHFSQVVIIPLLLIVLILIYRKKFLSKDKSILAQHILAAIIFILIVLPLLILIYFNSDTRVRSSDVFVTQDPNLTIQVEQYKDLNGLQKKLYEKKAFFDFVFTRYLTQLNPDYLFFNGLKFTNDRIIDIGPLYIFQLPLVLVGIIYLIRLKDFIKEKTFVFCWLFISLIPSALTFEAHSSHRIIIFFTMLNIVSGIGAYWLFKKISIVKRANLFMILILIGVIIIYNMISLGHFYAINYPYEKSQYIHYPFKQVAQFAWSEYNNYEQIVFDPLFGETAPEVGTAAHYYLAYYGKYPPEKFQKEYRLGVKPREVLFDKFSIRKIDWREDQNLKNTLIIASKWSLFEDTIEKVNIIKKFYFYNGEIAFYAIKL